MNCDRRGLPSERPRLLGSASALASEIGVGYGRFASDSTQIGFDPTTWKSPLSKKTKAAAKRRYASEWIYCGSGQISDVNSADKSRSTEL